MGCMVPNRIEKADSVNPTCIVYVIPAGPSYVKQRIALVNRLDRSSVPPVSTMANGDISVCLVLYAYTVLLSK